MKNILSVLFATAILLTATIATSEIQYADALKGQGVGTSKFGSSTDICGLQLCSEIPGGKAAYEQQQTPSVVIPKYSMEQKGLPLSPETVHEKRAHGEICQCTGDCNCAEDGTCTCSGEEGACMCGPNCTCGTGMHGTSECNCSEDGTCSCGEGCACDTENCNCSADGTCTCGEGCACGTGMHEMAGHKTSGHIMKAISGTMQSATDPGMGHEQHQLAVLLPPRDNSYAGLLTYSASENVQLVALHGPLAEGEDMGQTIWTPDGDTKFALTLVNPEDKMGTWMFTGNALAVHTFSEDPFAITYTVNYATVSDHSDISGACQCASDCNCAEDGTCTCSGEEGACMCGPNCTCGTGMHGTSECNCSEDGTCSCGEGCACDTENCNCSADGTCTCGEGCACGTGMHEMAGHKTSGHIMKAISGTMQSATDPGMGHEQHQLAVLLPPRDNSYAGLLTYSASENVQLVALHGPLAEGEDMGQTIWTPDGDTKFALTLVNPEDKMGTWMFTGNALAVHTFSEDPFAITYSIATMSSGADEYKMMHGTSECNCSEDGTCSCGEGCACSAEDCNCSADGTCTCGMGCTCGQ
ncbi:MAG: hypothetical protein ACW9XH_08170 [Candidatus Nitrosopumilus sp. bin_32a]